MPRIGDSALAHAGHVLRVRETEYGEIGDCSTAKFHNPLGSFLGFRPITKRPHIAHYLFAFVGYREPHFRRIIAAQAVDRKAKTRLSPIVASQANHLT